MMLWKWCEGLGALVIHWLRLLFEPTDGLQSYRIRRWRVKCNYEGRVTYTKAMDYRSAYDYTIMFGGELVRVKKDEVK